MLEIMIGFLDLEEKEEVKHVLNNSNKEYNEVKNTLILTINSFDYAKEQKRMWLNWDNVGMLVNANNVSDITIHQKSNN